MKEFQFLVKEKCFTYIDVNAVTFNEEKKQLLAQGFVFDDDRITSDTLENAIIKYKKRSHDKMYEYTTLGFIMGFFDGFKS